MKKMPVLFIGHGSPMNAIEDNEYTAKWETLCNKIPRPTAILCISAHWYTKGVRITDAKNPKMVYDMYGFPDELYQIIYGASGAPELAHQIKEILGNHVKIDNSWGLDHGAWSVLCRIYPKADIPVFQLSVDSSASAKQHFEIGQKLSTLREQGVLIIGSGNVVHNLSRVDWNTEGGFSWAEEFDQYIYDNIINRSYENVIHYERAGKASSLAFYTMDHFAPLLSILGASNEKDRILTFNKSCVLGSLSMTSYLFECESF